MTIEEIYCDLFSLQNEYILTHCVSADFALGAGIAKQFAGKGVKDALLSTYPVDYWNKKGYCRMVRVNNLEVANLVTKQRYYQKPTLGSVAEALIDFRDQLPNTNCKIAMPQIGCGLDRLNWSDVKQLICEIFEDTDCQIYICKLH